MSVEDCIIDRIDLYLDEEAAGADPSMTVLVADLSAIIRADERERLAQSLKGADGNLVDQEWDTLGVWRWLRSQTPPAGGG